VDSGLWLEVQAPEDGSGAAGFPLTDREALELAAMLRAIVTIRERETIADGYR
jgi:hypothetical protein